MIERIFLIALLLALPTQSIVFQLPPTHAKKCYFAEHSPDKVRP